MKAIVIEKAGGIENLHMKDIAQPTITDNDVLVGVKAISINPADVKVKYAEEGLNMICGPTRPIILGWDIAGTVAAVGKNVTQFSEGDRVFGMVNFPGHGKAYAEYVAAPEEHLAKIPSHVSFEEAAATTLAALTALQVLQGNVNKGDKVLIHAGSGGVGHFAVQIAKHRGAYVVSTSSAKNRDFILSLGADEHIDYRSQAFEELLSDIDFVFDTLGGQVMENSLKVLKEGGRLVSIAAMEVPEDLKAQAEKRHVTVSTFLVKSSGKDMNTLKDLLADESLKPSISKTFDFAEMGKAHTEVEGGRTVGKVIVTLK